jgi:hypothetical protein
MIVFRVFTVPWLSSPLLKMPPPLLKLPPLAELLESVLLVIV